MFQRDAFLPPAPSATAKDQRSASDDATPLLCFCSGAEKPAPRLLGARCPRTKTPTQLGAAASRAFGEKGRAEAKGGDGNVMY